MSKQLFFLSLALSPTQEVQLMHLQRSCFHIYRHPSAFALPPILPLSCFNTYREAQKAWEETEQKREWKPFILSSLHKIDRVLIVCPDPLMQESSPLPPAPIHGIEDYPHLPGFYLTETGEDLEEPTQSIPFQPFPVRIVRLMVLKVFFEGREKEWWKRIVWSIEKEAWKKLH
jgi:hypothetical protein